jgi:hypothetical protein
MSRYIMLETGISSRREYYSFISILIHVYIYSNFDHIVTCQMARIECTFFNTPIVPRYIGIQPGVGEIKIKIRAGV